MRLIKVLRAEDLAKREAVSVDLTPYKAILQDALNRGLGAEVEPSEGENIRTMRRRFSLAAKELELELAWRGRTQQKRTGSSTSRFVLRPAGAPVPFPGARTLRQG